MTSTRRRIAALSALISIPPIAAHAYVRMRNPDGTALEWRRGCPRFTIEASGGAGMSAAEVAAAIEDARDHWTTAGGACTRLPIEVIAHDGRGNVGFDGASLVLWRAADHCDDPEAAGDELCLSPNAAAITTLFYYERGDRAGEVLEADVELNGAIDFGRAGEPARIDLAAALTHELGHALGLEHTCDPIPGRAPLSDSTGAPVPGCFPLAALPAAVRSATMFPFLKPGDLGARTPLDDELGAVCQIYGGHDGRCEDTGPGCGCTGGSDRGAAVVALIPVVWWWRRRRR